MYMRACVYSRLAYPRGGIVHLRHMQHPDKKKALVRRLKLIEGQVRGLARMVEEDAYCINIITQTSAVKAALSNVEDILMEGHLSHCLIDQVRQGKPDKAKEEILKVYKLKRK